MKISDVGRQIIFSIESLETQDWDMQGFGVQVYFLDMP